MREVITYMIERTADGDEDGRWSHVSFGRRFARADLERDTVETLREFTPKLIPMLLTNMAYAEDDEEVLAAEDDEANAGREDRDRDIQGQFQGAEGQGRGWVRRRGREEEDRGRRRRKDIMAATRTRTSRSGTYARVAQMGWMSCPTSLEMSFLE